jgi:hypothetical protein
VISRVFLRLTGAYKQRINLIPLVIFHPSQISSLHRLAIEGNHLSGKINQVFNIISKTITSTTTLLCMVALWKIRAFKMEVRRVSLSKAYLISKQMHKLEGSSPLNKCQEWAMAAMQDYKIFQQARYTIRRQDRMLICSWCTHIPITYLRRAQFLNKMTMQLLHRGWCNHLTHFMEMILIHLTVINQQTSKQIWAPGFKPKKLVCLEDLWINWMH